MDKTRGGNAPLDTTLTATASTPVELLQTGLRLVLDLARSGRPPAGSAGTVAIPIRGLGPDLERLFLDLCDDLISQLEVHGLDLDEIVLDGLLQTDTGGYTAWGYLSGLAADGSSVPLALVAESVTVTSHENGLALTGTVRMKAA